MTRAETTTRGTEKPVGHTPGPWAVRENPNGTLGIDAKEPDGSECQPARINGDATDPVYGPVTRANAKLIAAAPDLLEAAKFALARFEKLMNDGAGTHADRNAMHALRAAIAKAS